MIPKIGEILVKEGLISTEQLNQAIDSQQNSGDMLGSIITKLGFIDEIVLVEFLSKQFQSPAIDPLRLGISKDTLDLLPAKLVQKFLFSSISPKQISIPAFYQFEEIQDCVLLP